MVEEYLNLLGKKGKDNITGQTGVVTSVCFDLYGCVMVDLKPDTLDKEGKIRDGMWFDHKRIEITSKKPVMDVPDFSNPDKPSFKKPGEERGASDRSSRRA